MKKQRAHRAPRLAVKILETFCEPVILEEIQGDLEEEFAFKQPFSSHIKAQAWYYLQVIKLLRPSLVRKVEIHQPIEKELIMFRNYVKIGLRNLWKHKNSTAINVIGLSVGLAAFVLIALYVQNELSYDRHHVHGENVYRVTIKNYDREGNMSRQWAFGSAGHAKRLKADYTEISHSVRFYLWAFPDLEYNDQRFRSEQVVFTDNDVFDIFSFKFIIGNAETALTDLYSIVLTEESAIKIFGNDWRDQNILDKKIKLSRNDQSAPFKVTGVMENMPDQQHFHFEYLAPIRFLEMIVGEEAANNVSGNYNWLTYVRIHPGSEVSDLEESANATFWDKYIGKFESGIEARNYYDFNFQPLLDIHLQSNLEGEFETNGSIQQIYIFSGVAILLLLVACINYMNLATSHYSRRMKEVGVRKVVGANRSSLVKQFLTESLLITVLSLLISLVVIYWALPILNNFMDRNLTLNPFQDLGIVFLLLALVIGVALIAGFYPSVFLARTRLVNALKGEQSMNAGKWNFRSWLVTFQYAVTIALIFSIAVIESQMSFIQNKDPGYQKEQVLSLSIPRDVNYETFRNELLQHPKINKASYSSRIPTGRLMDNWGSTFYNGDSAVSTSFRLPIVSVDEYFLDTYEIGLVAGENFRKGTRLEMSSDSIPPARYIVNEAAAKAYGYSPEELIGKKMTYGPTEGRIIGVMKDFHFESMHSPIFPMIILNNENYRRVSLEILDENVSKTLEDIEEIYAQFDPEGTANYNFVSELFNDQYKQEQRLGQMIKVFAVIAIMIGCLGLIGMVGFIIETKLKEIGVRKVLGASVQSIWALISKRFLILIGLAIVIAMPITYWLMLGWLDNFVYRTSISFWILLIPILSTVLITMLSTSFQTLKAANVNPVECLKDE